MSKTVTAKTKARQSWTQRKSINVILMGLTLILVCAEITLWIASRAFSWTYLLFTIEIEVMVVLWYKSKTLQSILGEHRHPKRTRIHMIAMWIFTIMLLFPLTYYVLFSGISSANIIEPLSLLVVAPTLGGLVLATASLSNLSDTKKAELISVGQKFIGVAVLFVIFTPSMFFVNALKVNPNVPDVSSLNNLVGGIYFWIALPSFYLGIVLFLLGLIDLVFAVIDIFDKKQSGRLGSADLKD